MFPTREPTVSELEFFKWSGVPGYAAPDDMIVMNPNAPPGVNMDAVKRNEGFRLMMRTGKVPPPAFQITPEQMQAFEGTPYGQDEQALRETIAARIATGDPSAGNATDEQRAYVESILNMGGR